MRKQIQKVVIECNLCNKSKADRHAPYKFLQLPTAQGQAWKSIAFNFIVKLLPSKEPIIKVVYNFIWVVTDRTTKYGHFVPYKKSSNAKKLAYIFIKIVVSQYELPDEIILNRDKLFTSKFWKLLIAQLGANYKLLIAFYPQIDR